MPEPIDPPPFSVRHALKSSLAELEGCWIDIRCTACGRTALVPTELMGSRIDPRHRLTEIVPRLSCNACRAKPATVHLCETHNREFCYGAEPGWSVQLHPLP